MMTSVTLFLLALAEGVTVQAQSASPSSTEVVWCVGQSRANGAETWYGSAVATGLVATQDTNKSWRSRLRQEAGQTLGSHGECLIMASAQAASQMRTLYAAEVAPARFVDLSYRPGDFVADPLADTAINEADAERARSTAAQSEAYRRQNEEHQRFLAQQAADRTAYEAALRANQAATAQYQRDQEKYQRDKAAAEAATAAAQARYEQEQRAWREEVARVAACNRGDRSQCRPASTRQGR